jgi:hypothetical protein
MMDMRTSRFSEEQITGFLRQAQDFTNQHTRYNSLVDKVQRAKNRSKSRIPVQVEHVFEVWSSGCGDFWQGALAWFAQERNTGVHGLGAGQHLS